MFNVFKPMSMAERHAQRAAYQQVLTERDGLPDSEGRTLPRRETRMAQFTKPLPRLREIDHGLFYRQYAHFDPKLPMSPELVLLLAMVKVNAAEAYGVKRTIDAVGKQALASGDNLELQVLLQEDYHTRILLSSACLYGLTVDAPYDPAASLRAFIGAIAATPDFLARPLTLAGEIVGTLLFVNLLEWVRQNLGHDSQLRDAIEERIIDVLIDEIGHISYNRMHMGALALAQTRAVLPFALGGVTSVAPELALLGVLPKHPGRSIASLYASNRLPESIRKQAFFA